MHAVILSPFVLKTTAAAPVARTSPQHIISTSTTADTPGAWFQNLIAGFFLLTRPAAEQKTNRSDAHFDECPPNHR
jgi:hypothetical protein